MEQCKHDGDFLVKDELLPEGKIPAAILPFVTCCEHCGKSYHEVWMERGAPYADAVRKGRYPATLEEALRV